MIITNVQMMSVILMVDVIILKLTVMIMMPVLLIVVTPKPDVSIPPLLATITLLVLMILAIRLRDAYILLKTAMIIINVLRMAAAI
jgi:hypothetical protein